MFAAILVEVRNDSRLERAQYGFKDGLFVAACPMCAEEFTAPMEDRHYNANTQSLGGMIRLGCGFEGWLTNGQWKPT